MTIERLEDLGFEEENGVYSKSVRHEFMSYFVCVTLGKKGGVTGTAVVNHSYLPSEYIKITSTPSLFRFLNNIGRCK